MKLIDKVIPKTTAIAKHLRDIEKEVRCSSTCDPLIHVLNPTVFASIVVHAWHPKLIEVFNSIYYKHRDKVIITSGWRYEEGIHGTIPLRAVDIRSTLFEDPREVEKEINRVWNYGKAGYNVCLFHRRAICRKCKTKFDIDVLTGVVSGVECPECHADSRDLEDLGPHFHIQVCDNTQERLS